MKLYFIVLSDTDDAVQSFNVAEIPPQNKNEMPKFYKWAKYIVRYEYIRGKYAQCTKIKLMRKMFTMPITYPVLFPAH